MADSTTLSQTTVLVVEDDPCVLEFVSWCLKRLSYKVLETRTATDALQILALDEGDIDLLFADVVLPDEPNGIELARRAQRAFGSRLKILLTTAYLKEDIFRQYGPPEEEMGLLLKPYTQEQLAGAIQNALDAPGQYAHA